MLTPCTRHPLTCALDGTCKNPNCLGGGKGRHVSEAFKRVAHPRCARSAPYDVRDLRVSSRVVGLSQGHSTNPRTHLPGGTAGALCSTERPNSSKPGNPVVEGNLHGGGGSLSVSKTWFGPMGSWLRPRGRRCEIPQAYVATTSRAAPGVTATSAKVSMIVSALENPMNNENQKP
jgi:hypothetical protein